MSFLDEIERQLQKIDQEISLDKIKDKKILSFFVILFNIIERTVSKIKELEKKLRNRKI